MKVIENGERCEVTNCNGEIDKRYPVKSNPDIYYGKCFRCGAEYRVVCPK